jgi:DNA-binding NtrC family response regulator
MTAVTQRWPRGTGQWNRSRVLIVAADPSIREQLHTTWATDHEVIAASSPLDVIRWIEDEGKTISTVVLADVVGSVARSELAEFLIETYPFIRVILTSRHSEADRSQRDDLAALQ